MEVSGLTKEVLHLLYCMNNSQVHANRWSSGLVQCPLRIPQPHAWETLVSLHQLPNMFAQTAKTRRKWHSWWAPYSGGQVTRRHTCSNQTKRQQSRQCPRLHPFSPVLEPRQGGGICSLAGLTWPHVIIAVQAWGTPSAWSHVPRPPIQWVFIWALPVHSLPTVVHYLVLSLNCAL